VWLSTLLLLTCEFYGDLSCGPQARSCSDVAHGINKGWLPQPFLVASAYAVPERRRVRTPEGEDAHRTRAAAASANVVRKRRFDCKPVVIHNDLSNTTSHSRSTWALVSNAYKRRRAEHLLARSNAGISQLGSSAVALRLDACTEDEVSQHRLSSQCRGPYQYRCEPLSNSPSSAAAGEPNASVVHDGRFRRGLSAWSTNVHRAGWTGGNIISTPSSLQRLTRAHISTASSIASPVTSTTGHVSIAGGSNSPVILLVEPSGAIGFGEALSSLLIFGVFNVVLQALYVDGVRLDSADVTHESPYAIRLAYIPASPVPDRSALMWFNGAGTLSEDAEQDCDRFAMRYVTITFTCRSINSGNTDAPTDGDTDDANSVFNTTITLDGKDGRPLLARYCTFTPLLLAHSTSVRVMERWAVHDDDDTSVLRSAARTRAVVDTTHRLTLVMHPQYQRIAGQPQQDWEARIRRFSMQNAPFTYSDVDIKAGDQQRLASRSQDHAQWWVRHSLQAISHVAAKDTMISNVSFLWSVGEVTGDLATATVLRSVDVPQESYALYLVLPSLTLTAHTVTLPAVYGVGPYNGVRLWNKDWMLSTTSYGLNIHGAFPRSTLFVNQDVVIRLRKLRSPTLSDGDAYAYVETAVEDCYVSGAGDGDTFHCNVAVENDAYDASHDPSSTVPGMMESCGGGVVVDLFLVQYATSGDATAAVVDWDPSSADSSAAIRVTPVAGLPLSFAANSVLHLSTILDAVPEALQYLHEAATAAASGNFEDVENASPPVELTASRYDDWVTMRFSFLYQNRQSGIYQVHCDGSAHDMHVSISTYDDPVTPVRAHCIQSPSESASAFRHSVVSTTFDWQSTLLINASCSFRLATVLDSNATLAAFCGVALERLDIGYDSSAKNSLLPAYAVYELRIPMRNAANSSSASVASSEAQLAVYKAELSRGGASSSLAVFDLPRLFTALDCYRLPWWIVESAAARPTSARYGLRWGGFGYTHQTFPMKAADGTSYCHAFVAFHLPSTNDASLCPKIKLKVSGAGGTGGVAGEVLAQRVFCGSRSHFMDPISALQLRVPLVEVARLVDLDAFIPDTETGYLVYQYCVDVLFYLAETGGFTGAYAPNGPLVFTLLDTADTPSSFVPWVRTTIPSGEGTLSSSSRPLVLGDTLHFTGESLRYYDSTGKTALTGTRFTIQLATVDVEPCGDHFLVTPSGYYPNFTAEWINESTIELPITADVPSGWFNLTMTQAEAGEVYVNCGLSFRVVGSITSVTTTDVAGPAGGTTVRVRGVNLPMASPGTNVSLTLGYTNNNPRRRARRCIITSSLATSITCTTPKMTAAQIAQLAILTEESEYAYTYWLPVNLTARFYNSTSAAWEVFQSINVDTVAGGAELLSVEFRVSKMKVTDVWPLDVSRMEDSPTFHIHGTGIESHSVLLCDVATITRTSTPETTSCVLCLPRSFSAVELVCDALWPLNESAYRVYVSDTALEGDTGFIVRTHLSVSSVAPDFLYPYAEGVLLTISGAWFVDSLATDVVMVATLSDGSEERRYNAATATLTNTSIIANAPDLGWMANVGGTLSLHVFYGMDPSNPNDVCATGCTIPVIPEAMMPTIRSISPLAGQAPMLIYVYGTGFTKLTHSPPPPATVWRDYNTMNAAPTFVEVRPGAMEEVGEAPILEETYISIGADVCHIVEMLNTLIVCNLTEPCGSLDPDNSVRLVSRTHGSTSTPRASSLFFYCTMSLRSISHTTGSIAGNQKLTISGMGFPSNSSQVHVTVAGAPCLVVLANRSSIMCHTTPSPTGRAATGPVVVSSSTNGRKSSCCVYTYSLDLTPTITSISPTKAAAGTQLRLYGTNFPVSLSSPGTLQDLLWAMKMYVIFGNHLLEVTEIHSATHASVTIPSGFFGRDYLSVHIPAIGNSPKYTDHMLTVAMEPSMVVPSSGGFRVQTPVRLVGALITPNAGADNVNALFWIYICGRRCRALDANEEGEVLCQVPAYMDEEMIVRHRASLSFPKLTTGFNVYVSSTEMAESTQLLTTAAPTHNGTWSEVSVFFGVLSEFTDSSFFVDSISRINIAAPELSLLLEAVPHSRLLLYSVVLVFSPTGTDMGQLDLTNAVCRLQLATKQAETVDLFTADANPSNASMWATYRGNEGSYFTWSSLQVGANTLNFNALETLPAAAYIRISCDGLPVNVLQLQEVTVNGYQVGLNAAGGRCPVNVVAPRRIGQPSMNSCPSRTGESCPTFTYRTSLTPVVMRYEPTYALASDVGARITLYGSGFGEDVSAVSSILLDKALCTPISVTDAKLVCAMSGRVSQKAEWQVLWTNESRRGEAMLLSPQPFYAGVAWSSYLAWRGEGLPKEGQIVVIPRFNTIVLDVSPPALTGMLVYGVLIISDDVDVELRLGLLAISETGALIAGSAERPHARKFTITLSTNFFQSSPLYYLNDISSLLQQEEPYLDKTLEVLGGTLQLHGMPPIVAKARLAVTAHPGDCVITVDRWVPWSVGDVIALVTKGDANPHHVERRIIVQRAANATHTILRFSSETPLAYQHVGRNDSDLLLGNHNNSSSNGNGDGTDAPTGWSSGNWIGEDDYAQWIGTDVVYLTRTICIRGDAVSTVSAVGASLWLINTTTSQLSHVEMYHTGKRGTKQAYSVWLQGIRYPADWVVLDDIVIHDSYFRGVVLQETRHVVINQLTVLHADGFGAASIGANDEISTVQNSSFLALYADSGGIDTVAAGLFVSSSGVALRTSEIGVCDGHGVWAALRFLFVSATERTCPGQFGMATLESNLIHHIGGHGILMYPLQLNVGDQCMLNYHSAAANDPMNAAQAEQLASINYTSRMQPAGTLRNQTIFSCGLHGIYLPPSSGYILQSVVVMDCALASLFVDYATNTTVVRDSFFSAMLGDGTCSSAITREYGVGSKRRKHSSEVAACSLGKRTGIQAQHGGHLALLSLRIGDFRNGSALSFATLSAPSSRATSYPGGSFAGMRSAHLTIRFFNFSLSDDVDFKVVLAGSVAMLDVDGQMAKTKSTTFFFSSDLAYGEVPSYCVLTNSTVGHSSGGDSWERNANEPDASPKTASSVEQASPVFPGAQRAASWAWAQGREAELSLGGGKKVISLVSTDSNLGHHHSNNGRDSGSGGEAHGSTDSWGDKDGGSTAAQPADSPTRTGLSVCVAPAKRLSLVFVHVSRVEPSLEGSVAKQCTSVTAKLRAHDEATPFSLHADMRAYALSTDATEASTVSFYVLTDDSETRQSAAAHDPLMPAVAYPTWHKAVASTSNTWGEAGYYTLQSNVNLTLAFRNAAGARCYPSALSISVDPSLPFPSSNLMVQVHISPSASYYERDPSFRTTCPSIPLMGTVSWTADRTREATIVPPARYITSAQSNELPHALAPSSSLMESTALLNLAHNPVCVRTASAQAAASIGNNNSTTTTVATGRLWDNSASLWAAVQITSCGSNDDANGIGCIGPHFPYLRNFIESSTIGGGVDGAAAPSSYTSWYSAEAWVDGIAPWNVNLKQRAQRDAAGTEAGSPSRYQDAYIIPYGTRVNLTLAEAVQVNGVLVVVGELLVTTAVATAVASVSGTEDSGAAEGTPCYNLSITTLIVFGKLNISVADEKAPQVRVVLGASGSGSSTSGNASVGAYRLDPDTLVYPGTLYAAGEVTLTGVTSAPTVWRTTSMAHRNTTEFPACKNLADVQLVQEWCMMQVRWALGSDTDGNTLNPSGASLSASDMLSTILSSDKRCLEVMNDFLPTWMRLKSKLGNGGFSEITVPGWRRGDRVGVTSGGSSMYEAEEMILTRDIDGLQAHQQTSDSIPLVSIVTDKVGNGSVDANWTWTHGRDYARDETPRLSGYGVGSEAVKLTKTIVLDCAVPRSTRGRGCMVLITRQSHPKHLLAAPRFHASGVSVRHFGKGGQLRDNATPVQGVAPLTFLPAVYVNVSETPADAVISPSSITERHGYAVLSGSVIEDSYGTALYTDRRNTHLVMVDSAIWYSEGGGVRLDGGGHRIFMSGVVVAGTRYTRAASTAGDPWVEVLLKRRKFTYEDRALSLADTRVTSLCSVLLNHSHTYVPSLFVVVDKTSGGLCAAVLMAAAGAYIKNVVAGGSESEGFCLPWSGSGGTALVGNNTVHSSYVGLFLFRAAPAAEKAIVPYFSSKWTLATSAKGQSWMTNNSVLFTDPFRGPEGTLQTNPVISFKCQLDDGQGNVTTFARWVIFNNRYLGVYSSSHQNVTLFESDVFANPIGVALGVHPEEAVGSSAVLDSYIATFPRCSCTAAMYSSTTFDSGDDEGGPFWQVCQATAYTEFAWTPKGCGAVTFIDDTYHYTAVLALPSYEYVPLSYRRDGVLTAPASDLLESDTEGKLVLGGVVFGAVGDLNRCESNVCDAVATHVTGRVLRSAAIMGTAGESLHSSASLSHVEASEIAYAASCAPALFSTQNTPTTSNLSSGVVRGDDSDNEMRSRSVPVISAYRPLAGSPASVVRLRPTSSKPSLVWRGAAAVARVEESHRVHCADKKLCDAAANDAVVAALRKAHANPYVMTAVYDKDASLYNSLGSTSIYFPRAATAESPVPQVLTKLCRLAPYTDNDLLVCDYNEVFYQVRLHSTDDRVRSGVTVPLLFTQTILAISEATTVNDTANKALRGTTSTAAVLQPPEVRSAASPTSTINDAMSRSSAVQVAFQVPQGIVTIKMHPMAYPEALELRIAACTSPAVSAAMTTLIRFPLLDESVTVHVWLVRTREMLQSVRVIRSAPTGGGSSVAEVFSIDGYRFPYWSKPVGVARLPSDDIVWLKDVLQDNDTGVTNSSLLLQLPCGAQVRVHQLAYALLLLYTTSPADAVAQRLLRDGTTMTVMQLLPPERNLDVNTTFFDDVLTISVASLTPDTNRGVGMMMTIKVEAVDSFDYNVTAATLIVSEFAELFAALYSHPGHGNPLRAEASPHRDTIQLYRNTTTPAGTRYGTLFIVDVPFHVLSVMPPLLPTERHAVQTSLSQINVVKRGRVKRGSLIASAIVVPAVVVLVAMSVVLRYVMRGLRQRKAATVEAQRSTTSTMDISAAVAVVEPGDVSGAAPFTVAIVVWMAGVLYTTLGATLDKAGVTRSAAETVEVLLTVDPRRRATGIGSDGNLNRQHTRVGQQSNGAVAPTLAIVPPVKIARQLFLLPSYNVLSGVSAVSLPQQQASSLSSPVPTQSHTVAPVAALIPHARGEKRFARLSDPQRSQEADRQQYVEEWRLGTRALTHLLQRGRTSCSPKQKGALKNSGVFGPPTTPPSAPASPSDEAARSAAGRAGLFGSATGASPLPSSTLTLEAPHSAFPVLPSPLPSSISSTPGDTARVRHGGVEGSTVAPNSPVPSEVVKVQSSLGSVTANAAATPEQVIPVGMPLTAAVVTVKHYPSGALRHGDKGNSNNNSSGHVASVVHSTSVLARPPTLPPVASLVPKGGVAVSTATVPRPSASVADAVVSPRTPATMPVAIQSILTTSILAGVPCAYPSMLVRTPGTVPDTAANAAAALNGATGSGAAGATAAAVGFGVSPVGVPTEDSTVVLRGRGNIMFTTPDADTAAARTLRGVGGVPPTLNVRATTEDKNATFGPGI
jgi:hypothetical protein